MAGPTALYPRLVAPRIAEAMSDTPVVLVCGPRQAGKTTLVRRFADAANLSYLSLDDENVLRAARADPIGTIRGFDRAAIDEVQRAPQLLLAIKASVDADRRPGRFLLTGSANVMTLPAVADSLAGRMELATLLPLSQSEIHGGSVNWIESVFSGEIPAVDVPVVADALVGTVLRGGFPEAVARQTARRRTAWARQYVDAIVSRDVRDVASIDKLDQLPRFLRALAHVASQVCNYTRLAAQVGLDHKTAAKYVGVFEQMYLLRRVDAWAGNRLSRVIKSPKLQFVDAGLLAALLEFNADLARRERERFGSVLESFVFGELLKHTTTAEATYRLLYYRDHDQFEVDLVVENAAGDIVGVEAKAAATVTDADLRGLRRLAAVAGERFRMGVVLYDGSMTLPLGKRLWAVPLSTLWGGAGGMSAGDAAS